MSTPSAAPTAPRFISTLFTEKARACSDSLAVCIDRHIVSVGAPGEIKISVSASAGEHISDSDWQQLEAVACQMHPPRELVYSFQPPTIPPAHTLRQMKAAIRACCALPSAAKGFLVGLTGEWGRHGSRIYPSINEIATNLGCSQRSVRRHLAALITLGVIAQYDELVGGQPVYRLNLDRLTELSPSDVRRVYPASISPAGRIRRQVRLSFNRVANLMILGRLPGSIDFKAAA